VFGPSPLAVPQQAKRLTPPAIALRSKSMTLELEDMGKTIEEGGWRSMKTMEKRKGKGLCTF
jgi:hypothetical protein